MCVCVCVCVLAAATVGVGIRVLVDVEVVIVSWCHGNFYTNRLRIEFAIITYAVDMMAGD